MQIKKKTISFSRQNLLMEVDKLAMTRESALDFGVKLGKCTSQYPHEAK
jgi:hypothetical protein